MLILIFMRNYANIKKYRGFVRKRNPYLIKEEDEEELKYRDKYKTKEQLEALGPKVRYTPGTLGYSHVFLGRLVYSGARNSYSTNIGRSNYNQKDHGRISYGRVYSNAVGKKAA